MTTRMTMTTTMTTSVTQLCSPQTSNRKNKTTLFPSILKVDKIKWSYFFDLVLRGRDTAVMSEVSETNPGHHPFLKRHP